RNTSGYQLYPGPLSLFLDDSYVANAEIKHVNLNEYFSCSLGIDPTVSAHHNDTHRSLPRATSSYAPRTETQLHVTRFVVKNRGRVSIPRLVVKAGLPVVPAELVDDVRVVLRAPRLVEGGEAVRGDVAAGPDAEAGSGGGGGGSVGGVVARWARYEGGEKTGRLEFVCEEVAAGAEVTFALEYEVTGPVDMDFAVARG
ncbi:hypothetical protein HK405_000114, partial [Cladochytrium tenue]